MFTYLVILTVKKDPGAILPLSEADKA